MNTIDSLYIHFPLCRHLCNYCDFYKTAPSDKERFTSIDQFHDYLSMSFNRLNQFMAEKEVKWKPLDTLYIGGGTPSLWGEAGVEFLESNIINLIEGLSPECEATLEVNPGSWTAIALKKFKKLGFNRFSLGVQSTEDTFLKMLDRIHRKDEVLETLQYFKDLKVNFSVDFMLGLPFSEKFERDIIKELEEILSFNPTHISLYILTVKDNYTHFKDLPNDVWIENEFLTVSKYLRDKGFLHYEVSNFALEGFESRHNSKYWKGGSIAALGPSATGYFSETKTRFKWKTNSPEIVTEDLSDKEIRLESFYLSLRTNKGIELKEFFTEDTLEDAIVLSQSWEVRGLCSLDQTRVILSPNGYLLLDSLMDEAFAALPTL